MGVRSLDDLLAMAFRNHRRDEARQAEDMFWMLVEEHSDAPRGRLRLIATCKLAALAHEYERPAAIMGRAPRTKGWSQSHKRKQDLDFVVFLGMRSGRLADRREKRKVQRQTWRGDSGLSRVLFEQSAERDLTLCLPKLVAGVADSKKS